MISYEKGHNVTTADVRRLHAARMEIAAGMPVETAWNLYVTFDRCSCEYMDAARCGMGTPMSQPCLCACHAEAKLLSELTAHQERGHAPTGKNPA